ncbi:hypothetical protein [Streptomyces sp. NPDC048659]|uniref:hypothetical protein n=1 Tax=Streptomyces sp. NPDC048659 TaxID=3155489 RepID=UPI003414FFA4
MSFDQEWAMARGASAPVGTRLNQVTAGPGGGNADLSVDQDRLGAIGSAAYVLHGRLAKDGDHARTQTAEAATGLKANGFRTGAAMAEVHDTWSSQLRTLLDACANISNHLDYSAASHAREEADIKAALATSKINEYLK